MMKDYTILAVTGTFVALILDRIMRAQKKALP